MKKTSIREMYFFTMGCHIFALMCGIVGSIIMLIYSDEFMNNLGKILGLTFVVCVTAALILLALFSLKKLVVLFKDYASVKNGEYISITAKVVKFKRNTEPESGAQINDTPIVIVTDTKEEIVLTINDKIAVGETYRFNYLKNCKIAEVSELDKSN